MGKTIEMEPPAFCVFCGRPKSMVDKLVMSQIPASVFVTHPCICNECIDAAYEIIHEGNEKHDG